MSTQHPAEPKLPLSLPTRRDVVASAVATFGLAATPALASELGPGPEPRPVAVASGNGLEAVRLAVARMEAGEPPVEAAVDGVGLVEADPNDVTVGYGGLPNSDGVVQLDACCMDGDTMRAGAVAALERVKHPSRVALEVLRRTTRVLLVGEGALRFARSLGFPEEELLTERARKIWLYWRPNMSDRDDWLPAPGEVTDPDVAWFIDKYGPVRPTGTINLCAVDARGRVGGTTTTSGLAFKMPGRVGRLAADRRRPVRGRRGRRRRRHRPRRVGHPGRRRHTVVELMRAGLRPGRRLPRDPPAPGPGHPGSRPPRRAGSAPLQRHPLRGEPAGKVGSAAMWSGSRYAVCRAGAAPQLQDCAFLYRKA